MNRSVFCSFHTLFFAALAAVFCFVIFPYEAFAEYTATTTVRITVCGDGVVGDGENCDNGFARNMGQYSLSIAGSQCYPGCADGPAPFCGDEILQPLYGEECDDMNNFSGDTCSAICKNEAPPATTTTTTTGGGGGGSGVTRGPGDRDGTLPAVNPTKVIIDGRAYNSTLVTVLKDGKQIGVAPTNDRGEFHFETSDMTPGPVIFGFWAEDSARRRSITMTTTFQVIDNAVTTVTGVYLPPTLEVGKKTLTQGTKLDVVGESVASSTVFIYFDSQASSISSAKSGSDGKWNGSLDTKALANEKFHTVRAKTETVASDGSVKKSGFSQAVGFYVGTKELTDVISPDINKDGKVNIIDFSILLFYWNSSEVTCDFNRDSKVNLTDFSIMLYAWTG